MIEHEEYPENIESEMYEKESYGCDPYVDWKDADVSIRDFV